MSRYNLPQVYNGGIIDQMPKLIADGKVPMSVSQLMQKRLYVRNASNDIKSFWMDNYLDTGDAIVYRSDGKFSWDKLKIDLDSQYLRAMTPQTRRNWGALILTPEQYNAIDGEEFGKSSLGKTESWLPREDIKVHPIWRALARDQELLNDYVDLVFTEGKDRFGYNVAMAAYIDLTHGSLPEMRGWCVCGLGNWSDICCDEYINSNIGRLIGVRLDSRKNDLGIKAHAMADFPSTDKSKAGLEETLHSNHENK